MAHPCRGTAKIYVIQECTSEDIEGRETIGNMASVYKA